MTIKTIKRRLGFKTAAHHTIKHTKQSLNDFTAYRFPAKCIGYLRYSLSITYQG